MSEPINIVKLIEENPNTKLSKSYESKLINKLKDNFATEKQQLFISSFYCYLNYKSYDFVIDLDNIWKWLGFSRKNDSKKVLEKHFKADIDYKIVLRQAPQNLSGGRPSEKIMMTIKTFKKLCLKANTSKANEIHEYYIKLEEILHELIDEESNELRLQLEQKEDELLEIKEELEEKETLIEIHEEENKKKSNRIKLLEIKASKKGERIEQGKNVVYLITNEYLEKDRTFIVGKAICLASRLSQYNKNAEHEVVYHRECKNAKQMALIEENVLYKLDKFRERCNRDRFILPKDTDISVFTNVIDHTCDWFNDVIEDVIVERLKDDKDKEYYEDNKEYIKEYKKQHYQENKEEIEKKKKVWYEEHKEQVSIYYKKYREENLEKINVQKKIYKEEHKQEYKDRNAKYYTENKEEIQKKKKIYQEENRDKIKKQRDEYYEKNREKIQAKDRERNPKVICDCGLSLCKRSISAHKKSKTHESFMKIKIKEYFNTNVLTKIIENNKLESF